MKRNIGRRIICVMFFTAMLMPSLPLFAQKPRGGAVATVSTPKSGGKCNGAWTGNITYTRTQSMNETKTENRVSNRGKDTRRMEMSYNYKASVAVLESPERNGSNIGKANIDHTFKSSDNTEAREENSCDQGKTWNVMYGIFESKSTTRGQASNVEANVTVGVNDDGSYTVSVGLPQIEGMTEG
ncbi:MAG: hypothetical protein JNL64_05910, partial [Blastocatellia bacterium]|nr:hypothetical protein [Blastocatellia bacterium]